ncbi:MAG: AAA family ATPase [Pseudomonadales bacterium]
MNQRTFLELTHNPFTPPREGFFGGADRRTHLDHIRHLSQWSRRVLLVTGPFGIGKSTMYRELSSNLEASTKAARLSGAVVTSEREIMLGLAQGFGVAVDSVAHIDEIVTVLTRHVEEESTGGRTCAVLIDDGQLLDFAAIGALMRLAAQSPLRLVLFAEATIIANVTKVSKKYELEWFEIRLTGFPAADVRGYLEWRFAQAQYRGRLPFTDAQVEQIAQRSGGNPNVIDFMANELLAELETGEYRRRPVRFPRRHLILAAVLVVLVGLLYQLYQQPDSRSVVTTQPVVPVPADDSIADAGLAEGVEVSTSPDTAAAEAPARSLQTDVADVSAEQSAGAGPAAPVTEPALVTATDSASDSTREETSAVTAQPVVEQPIATTPVQVEESEPAVVNTPAVTASTPPSRTPPPRAEPGDVNGIDWVRRQNPAYYTLQLMTLSRRAGGVAMINRQADKEDFALYPTLRDGREFHVLIYGVFSTRQAALARASNLSGELRDIKPWVRKMETIQASLGN